VQEEEERLQQAVKGKHEDEARRTAMHTQVRSIRQLHPVVSARSL
jgi:hypothetical protein